MIRDLLLAVDWGITVRHEDDCDGRITVATSPSLDGVEPPGKQTMPAYIRASCSKCHSTMTWSTLLIVWPIYRAKSTT